MNSNPFGTQYSKYYDLLYADKDYEKECDYLERIFSTFSNKPVRNIRDLACGTGGHDLPLAQRGYRIVASDISPAMIKEARIKIRLSGQSKNISLRVADMRNSRSTIKFNACICMFSSLGYLTELREVRSAFEKARAQLEHSGIFVFDFWNGLAVLKFKPRETRRITKRGNLSAVRYAKPSHTILEDSVSVSMTTVIQEDKRVIDEFVETHKVRYFFPTQIRFLLELSGFELVSLHPFMALGKEPSDADWNLTAVAKAGPPKP